MRLEVRKALPATIRYAIRRISGRGRVSRSQYETRYNLNQLQRYESVLNHRGLSFQKFSTILDFACGGGRLTQHLFEFAPQAQIFGCDVDSDAILECEYRCPLGHFYVNQPHPPLKYEDGKFDLVWSYGIFTSLSEANHQIWLKELARILKPGGVMLHTTHSNEKLRRASAFSPSALKKYEIPMSIDEFIKSGSGYHYVMNNPATPEYGLAIISKEYVLENWQSYSGLTLVDYLEAAIEAYPEGCQDIVFLRKD